jgi:hypothetical protein
MRVTSMLARHFTIAQAGQAPKCVNLRNLENHQGTKITNASEHDTVVW